MNQPIFIFSTVTLFGLGLYLLARQLLEILSDLLAGLAGYFRRRLRHMALRRLAEFQQQNGVPLEEKKDATSPLLILSGLLRWQPFWMATAALAALIFADALRSPLAFAVILTTGELYRATFRSIRFQKMNEDASSLILQFTSRYPMSRSLMKTIKDTSASLPGGEVRRAMEACLRRLHMNQKLAEAMKPLQLLGYPVLSRFGQVLSSAQDTNHDIFIKTLEILRNEVESRLELHRQARQSLTLVRGTVRVLQAVAGLALAIASTLPNWRSYFLASTKNWMLFVGMLGIVVLGSLYVETEMRQMEVG